jgi:transcriptional regulator
MYIPKHFELKDRDRALRFMRMYNFAVLVSSHENTPVATHLPFVIEERDGNIILLSHMSRANSQWKTLGKNALVIFSEPHAYISPSLYEKEQNVPTWNYVAVHAYGSVSILEKAAQQTALLEKQMHAFEEAYYEQWKRLDPAYRDNLRKGIVAFEIIVAQLQGKEKLSQNKTAVERVTIAEHLEQENDNQKKTIAQLMRENMDTAGAPE